MSARAGRGGGTGVNAREGRGGGTGVSARAGRGNWSERAALHCGIYKLVTRTNWTTTTLQSHHVYFKPAPNPATALPNIISATEFAFGANM